MFTYALDESSYLKLLEMKDAPLVFQLTDTNRGHLREWLPFVDNTQTLNDTRSFIEYTMKKFAANNGFEAGIWHRGELAGVIGFHNIDWVNRKTTIGYWLGAQFQGKGLMTKATHAFVDHAFTQLHLNRIEIRCAVGNSRSRAIPERLGFTQEGTIRQAEWLYDHYVDHIVYGMLAADWNTIKNR